MTAPNVAVVVLDTLRYDRFEKYFSWLDGIRFTNAYSTSHWTGSAHASLFTGQYPSEVGTTHKSRTLEWDGATLPEALQHEGYTTRMFSTNMQIYVWDGWERGFEERFGPDTRAVQTTPEGVFDWSKFVATTEATGVKRYANGLLQCLRGGYPLIPSLREGYRIKTTELMDTQAVMNRVQNTTFGDREFLFINIMDSHKPYSPPKTYRETDRSLGPEIEDGLAGRIDEPSMIKSAYDSCAQYISNAYRHLFADLMKEFDYVVTLADHGEHLGEHGLWAHVYGLNPELTHIPLVISGQGVQSKTVNTPVSILDVHQTVADAASSDVDSRGQNLLGEIEPRDRLVEYHGLAPGRRQRFEAAGVGDRYEPMDRPLDAIVSADGYAHETHEDGLEVTGRWSHDEAPRRLSELLNSIDRQQVTSGADDTDVSEEVQSRLEELGYV